MKSNLPTPLLSLLFGMSLVASAQAATYKVTNLHDSGDGSLRQAILDANDSASYDTIRFKVRGTIVLKSRLPVITDRVKIDGTVSQASSKPEVLVDANGHAGFQFLPGSNGSSLLSLAIGNTSESAVRLIASHITISGNYIGLGLDGKKVLANRGDGIHVTNVSNHNRIGNANPVKRVTYYAVNETADEDVAAWQGIRGGDAKGSYLICGTYGENAADGLLYIGDIKGNGKFLTINFPGAATTSIYGPDNLNHGRVRLVGSYKNSNASDAAVKVNGFIYEGTVTGNGKFRTIDYPGGEFTYVHSTMGGLAVGNSDGATANGAPLGAGQAFIYDVKNAEFIENIVYPGSKSNTAYGIWHNGRTSYTICGGYSFDKENNLKDPKRTPIGTAFLVDYDSATGEFSNWASFNYHNERGSIDFITHFEGISSVEKGVYTLNADSIRKNLSKGYGQGSFVVVRRLPSGKFGRAKWIDLNFPNSSGISSSNSVFGNQVVGLVIQKSGNFPFQATVNTGFQLGNVISGNLGEGIHLDGSDYNRIDMNYIGTDASGTLARGNGRNGILISHQGTGNIIGGQATGGNNPTGDVFVRPPQGNLISANQQNGVFLFSKATLNSLSGNFIGTTASGNKPLGNALDGVAIVDADKNELLGTTFRQNPFVFYNVISGNGGNGIRIKDSNNITVHANFLGVGANNATIVANSKNGLLVEGNSQNTQCGGVIPLGNVAAGNDGCGIKVTDRAQGFVTFNTFAGLYAFGGAAPNKQDGIHVSSIGGNNLLRTNVASGNLGNGIHLAGDARDVTVDPNIVGLDTNGMEPLPNGRNGILISGRAHHNTIGGTRQSVIPQNTVSANKEHGIAIRGEAHHNVVFNTYVGTNVTAKTAQGNREAGIYLGENTRGNVIGGRHSLPNRVSNNGVGIIFRGLDTLVKHNVITENETYGVYATGVLRGSVVERNAIAENESGVVLRAATGITVGERNVITDNTHFGVFATGRCTNSSVRRNTITGNGTDVSVGGAQGLTFVP